MNMKQRTRVILAVSATAFGLIACGKQEPPTVGQQVDKAIMQTQQAANDVKKDVQSAAENVKQDASLAANEVKKDVQAAAENVKKDASQAANDLAQGANDMAITAKVKAALASDKELSALAINVDTSNKVVSLSGPAPTPEASHRAATLAKGVDGVTDVKNNLIVMAKS